MKKFECQTPGISCSLIPEEIVFGCNYCLKKKSVRLTEGQKRIISSREFIESKYMSENGNTELLFLKGIVDGYKNCSKCNRFVVDELTRFLEVSGLDINEVDDYVKRKMIYN